MTRSIAKSRLVSSHLVAMSATAVAGIAIGHASAIALGDALCGAIFGGVTFVSLAPFAKLGNGSSIGMARASS